MVGRVWADLVSDHSLELADGRTVAWTQSGDPGGRPVLRVPGTPGSRWTVRADQQPWLDRGLLMITTERPGYGASTRLPGRGFLEPADDTVAILDHLGIASLPVYGASGGAPHILALCGRHPGRVEAATILSGAAPLIDAEADEVIPLNREARLLALAGDLPGLQALLAPIRGAILADPLASFSAVMSTAPPEDLAVMSEPLWQEAFVRAVHEALGQGVEGWADESLAMVTRWNEIALNNISTSVTWRHAPHDRNVPASAARRVVDGLPDGQWLEWPDGGHLIAYHREADVLEELLARAS